MSLGFNDSTSVMTPSSLMELKVINRVRNDLLVDRDDEKERIALCVNGVCKLCISRSVIVPIFNRGGTSNCTISGDDNERIMLLY